MKKVKKFIIKKDNKIRTRKKVRFLTFFLKKFENRLKIALNKKSILKPIKILEYKQKTALGGGFKFRGRA